MELSKKKEVSKFKELCMAFGRAQNQFENFQKDCHQFSIEMVNELIAYFKIPDSQFSLFKINAQNEFNLVQPGLVHALTLRPDSLWQFGIGLTVCTQPETLPQELILIHLLIRNDLEDNFFLRYANKNEEEEQEHKIEKIGDKFNFIPFFDYLHETIIKSYDDELRHFIGTETRRKIGYS